MKVRYNGEEYNLNISKYKMRINSASKGQQTLGELLLQLYPNVPIFEEVPCKGTGLRLDFYIRLLSTAFEFNGVQHKEYNPFFHGNRRNFAQAQRRDMLKKEWCDQNSIKLISLEDGHLTLSDLKLLIENYK